MEKYSDKFLSQSHKLKNARIGMEFEFYAKGVSYYKILELLNKELSPVKVWGFRQYHSDFEPDDRNFKIEPDLSGGANMVELVTGPLDYYDAKYYLIKISKFIEKYGYTNDKCSVHLNISFSDDDLDLNYLNKLKLILSVDEEEVFRNYPSRKGNIYTKSIKKIIPFKEYDFFNIPISIVRNNLRIPRDKYYGVNMLNSDENRDKQRVEFRYIGGKDYEFDTGKLLYFLDKFTINVFDCINAGFDRTDADKLSDHLEVNIKNYKNLSLYDNFIVEFPKITIQIDQRSQYEIVSPYYDKIYNKIYNIIESTEEISECIINYVTTTQTIEIVDADIETNSIIKSVEFINCDINGIFNNCFFVGCEINDSHITKSDVRQCDIENSKIFKTNTEESTLENCFFMGGYMNSDMIGGVFRNGKLGPYASMNSDVKIVKQADNFFNTKQDEDDKGSMDDKDMKSYKKSY